MQHLIPLISCSWSRAFQFQFLSCQYCPALVAPLSPCEALSARWGAATPGHRLHMGAFRSAPHLASYFLTFALPCILRFGTYQLPIVDIVMGELMWYHFKWMHIFCVFVVLMTSAFERRPPPYWIWGWSMNSHIIYSRVDKNEKKRAFCTLSIPVIPDIIGFRVISHPCHPPLPKKLECQSIFLEVYF